MEWQFLIALICHLVIYELVKSEPSGSQTYPSNGEKVSTPKVFMVLSETRKSRIIGGEPASIVEYPYVVSLQTNGTFFGHDFEHFCGGNIIGEKWILTAAKCCYEKKPGEFHVRIGSKFYYDGGRIHEIETIVIHPKYDQVTWDYDVGLLKSRETMVFSETVRPIELPKLGRVVEAGTLLDIVGWGATKILGLPSDVLYRNSIPTISQDDCRAAYPTDSMTDRMFCVFEMGNGPCIGDTGSPAVIDGVIIGVASWSQSCAYKYPTAYARLPEMVDWIIKVTGNTSTKSHWQYQRQHQF